MIQVKSAKQIKLTLYIDKYNLICYTKYIVKDDNSTEELKLPVLNKKKKEI